MSYPKRKPKLNRYDLGGEYGIGYTSKGAEFYFDLEDFDLIKGHTWFKDGKYVKTRIDGRNVAMSRLIMDAPNGMVVDHKNHIKHDNRKENLRICTSLENSYNRTPSNDADICGVSYHSRHKKWYARISDRFLGYFDNREDAVKARRKAEEEYYGEYSYANSINNEKEIENCG